MTALDLVNVAASAINPTRLVITQKDGNRPFHLHINHPGVVEYTSASGQGNVATGDLGWYFNGRQGRESITLDMGGDARAIIEVREAGVKGAAWQELEDWQDLVGATRVTGNPAQIKAW